MSSQNSSSSPSTLSTSQKMMKLKQVVSGSPSNEAHSLGANSASPNSEHHLQKKTSEKTLDSRSSTERLPDTLTFDDDEEL